MTWTWLALAGAGLAGGCNDPVDDGTPIDDDRYEASSSRRPRRASAARRSTSSESSPPASAHAKACAYDVEITIIDPRTKAPVAKKTFAGRAACPSSYDYSPGGRTPTVLTGPAIKPVHAWVVSQLDSLAKAAQN